MISDEKDDTLVRDTELYFEQQNANDESGLPEELNDSIAAQYKNPPMGLASFPPDDVAVKKKDLGSQLVRPSTIVIEGK